MRVARYNAGVRRIGRYILNFAIVAIGMAAPLIGLAIARSIRRQLGGRGTVVAVYYFFALLLAAPVLRGSESAALVCSFFLLMPVGVVIGVLVILPPMKNSD
jgi:hypothetical protein